MRITGSGLQRLSKCRAVVQLRWSSQESAAASFGSVLHDYLKNVPVMGKEMALLHSPSEHWDALDSIELDSLPASEPDAYAYEVAFIYDPLTDTAVEAMRGGDRIEGGYSDHLVIGTADVVGLTPEAVVILDYKSGWADLGDPAKSWQLRFYALAAARAYGRDEAYVGYIFVREGMEPIYRRAKLSSMDLLGTAVELRRLVDRALDDAKSGVPQRPHQGAHCKYCPAFDFCPAKHELALRVARTELELSESVALGSGDAVEQVVRALSDEAMSVLFERVELHDAFLDRVRAVMKERAATRPIQLEDGYVYGTKQHKELRLDAEAAMPVLEAAYGLDVAIGAVEVRKVLTQASLERGLRSYIARTPDAKATKTRKDALQLLREKGAAHVRVTDRVMKHRPKEE